MVIVPHSLWGDDVVSQSAIVPPLNDTDVAERERGNISTGRSQNYSKGQGF